jgi:phosphatidylglycerophosphate synthase
MQTTSSPTAWQRTLPWSLIGLRFVLAPVAVVLAWAGVPGFVWLMQFALAAWSDVYDGRFARRYGVVSAKLRQADSVADTVYFLGVFGSMAFAHPALMREHLWPILLVLVLEAGRYPLDWWKFGRGASYHAISAKAFGVMLVIAVVAIMGFGAGSPWLWIALAVGVISELEGIAISLILPVWTHDVPSVFAALAIRRDASAR